MNMDHSQTNLGFIVNKKQSRSQNLMKNHKIFGKKPSVGDTDDVCNVPMHH